MSSASSEEETYIFDLVDSSPASLPSQPPYPDSLPHLAGGIGSSKLFIWKLRCSQRSWANWGDLILLCDFG